MAFSTYLGNALLNEMLKNTNFAPLATVYVSYHTGDPGLTGANEVSGNNYARASVASADWGTVSGKTVSNANAITFNQASGSQGTITHVGIWDALTTGNFLCGGALTTPVVVSSGNTPQFAVGDLDVTVA